MTSPTDAGNRAAATMTATPIAKATTTCPIA
jgi:hypothetical protein